MAPIDVLRFIGRNSRRVAVSVIGALVVVAGLIMLVLPGPGLLVIAAGFAVLGTEYAWAAAALERTKVVVQKVGTTARSGAAAVGRTAKSTARAASRRTGGTPQ